MNAPSPPAQTAVRFAEALGLTPAELPAVGAAFSSLMAGVGVDGKMIFRRLCEGKSLVEALRLPPGAAAVLYARAHSWFSIGRVDKAGALFRGLCAIDGAVADHWVGLGVCLKMQGRLPEAERALQTGASRRPDWALPYFHLTECFMRAGDRPRASAALAEFYARAADGVPDLLRGEAERCRAVLSAPPRSADKATSAE